MQGRDKQEEIFMTQGKKNMLQSSKQSVTNTVS